MDNVRKIGGKWGPVLSIDNRVDDVCSLTYARMLVRTKVQNKIDVTIRLQFDDGNCDVWIKECAWRREKQNKTELGCAVVSDSAYDPKQSVAILGIQPVTNQNALPLPTLFWLN